MTTVYLVRHAQAEGNAKKVFQGTIDSEISDIGRKQLECLKERFKDIPFDAIYSSPKKRAYQTAQIANTYMNHEIRIVPDLCEIDGGDFEGRVWATLCEVFPEEYKYWERDSHLFKAPGGESMRQVYDRMSGAILKIVSENVGKRIVVTSHGCSIRNFLCFAKGWGFEKLDDVDWCDNTAISVIEFDEDLRPNIVIENDAGHLNDDIATFAQQSWWKRRENEK